MRWERTSEAASTAPAAALWAVLIDGRHWSWWYEGVAWMTIEGELAAGTVVTMKPNRAPQTAFRIEAVVPERLLALAVTFGPLATLRLRWELNETAGTSRIAQTVAIDGVAGLLLGRAARRIADAMPANLARLTERAASLQP